MERKIEQIERYLMNEMSVREQIEFEELLRSDPDLMQEFLLRKKVNEAIQEKDIINLRNSLSDITNSDVRIRSRKTIILTYTSVAAAVILLLVTANVYFNPFNKLDQQEVFQSHYKAYPSVNGYRSGNELSNVNKKLVSAFNYYDEANYKKAEEHFKAVLEKDPSNSMTQFYLAVCFMENNKLLEAEIYLKDLMLKQDHLFWEQSHWYLALIYVDQGKSENAKSILKRIIQEEMSYASEAKKILKSLN